MSDNDMYNESAFGIGDLRNVRDSVASSSNDRSNGSVTLFSNAKPKTESMMLSESHLLENCKTAVVTASFLAGAVCLALALKQMKGRGKDYPRQG